jgi:hypothetical protein
VRAEPRQFLKERSPIDKLLGRHPTSPGNEVRRFPVMYPDKYVPTYQKTFLFGLDFDFMILECLVIASMDRCNYLPNGIQSGLAFGVLMAFIFDYMLIGLRVNIGKRNLALHTLSDERFMI